MKHDNNENAKKHLSTIYGNNNQPYKNKRHANIYATLRNNKHYNADMLKTFADTRIKYMTAYDKEIVLPFLYDRIREYTVELLTPSVARSASVQNMLVARRALLAEIDSTLMHSPTDTLTFAENASGNDLIERAARRLIHDMVTSAKTEIKKARRATTKKRVSKRKLETLRAETAQADARERETRAAQADAATRKPDRKRNTNGDIEKTIAAYLSGENADRAAYDNAIITLSHIVAFSVLRQKVYRIGTDVFTAWKKDIVKYNESLAKIAECESKKKTRHKRNGDIESKYTDGAAAIIAKEIKERVGDGTETVNTACMFLLSAIDSARRVTSGHVNVFSNVYQWRVLDTNMLHWYDGEKLDNVSYFKHVEKSVFMLACLFTSRYVDKMLSTVNNRHGDTKASYIETVDTETKAVRYIKTRRYYDAGNHATIGDIRATEKAIALLKLTDIQKDILTYRLRGFGYKKIARIRGVSDDAIKKACKEIQKKARACGVSVEKIEKAKAETAKKDTDAVNIYKLIADADVYHKPQHAATYQTKPVHRSNVWCIIESAR